VRPSRCKVAEPAAESAADIGQCIGEQLGLCRLQLRLLEAHGAAERGEQLRVGAGFAERVDHRIRELQQIVAVRLVQLALLEHGGRRQQYVGKTGGVGAAPGRGRR
jgi:hypothetical protein